MKTCTGKERRSSNYSGNVGRLQEETKTQQAKKKTKKRKITMTQLATFIVHCGKKYKEGNVAYIRHM